LIFARDGENVVDALRSLEGVYEVYGSRVENLEELGVGTRCQGRKNWH
jgi:hypothetical protein